ncbi:MAG: hypothetical protein JNK64_13190 [Myxococcales bacterium]|nr:hypothetical protein [Myxococcales bacterium]
MSLKPLSLFMSGVPTDGLAPAVESLPRLLRAFADSWFRVRAALYDFGEGRRTIGAWDVTTPWRDEVRAPGEALSTCTERDEEWVLQALADRISHASSRPLARLEIELRGAVACVDADGVHWCGRWWPDGTAYPLTTLRFVFTPEAVDMVVTWPVSGFPLSATRPGEDGLADGDPMSAWRQRCWTLPAIAVAPDLLGMLPASIRWSFDTGGGAVLAVLRSSLGSWSSALNQGTAGPGTEPRPAAHDDYVADLVASLHGGGSSCGEALRSLIERPDHDPRVRAAIEGLRNDATPCLVEPPALWGPISLLAEFALAAARWDDGDFRSVTIQTAVPLSAKDMAVAERSLGLPPVDSSFEDPLTAGAARYARLRALQAVDIVEVPIEPTTAISNLTPVVSNPTLALESSSESATTHAVQQLETGGDPRIWALEDLARAPLAAPEVVATVTRLLVDHTPCDLDGETTGELCLLAAAALAAIRASVGDASPVHVEFVQPLSERALVEAAGALDVEGTWAGRRQLDADERVTLFSRLRAHGVLKTVQADLRAPVDFKRLARH